jgi:putative ABC transport system permease protein
VGSLRLPSLLASRQARRQTARSVAIITTLALPVAVATATDVVVRTTHLTRAEQLGRQLGGAQALVTWGWTGYPVAQLPDPGPDIPRFITVSPPKAGTPLEPVAAPSAIPQGLLPRGAVSTRDVTESTYLVSRQRGAPVTIHGVDINAGPVSELVRVRSGRPPSATGEIALSPSLAGQLGVRDGDTVRIPGRAVPLRVVGTVAWRYQPDEVVAFTTTSTESSIAGPFATTDWYVQTGTPIGWNDVLRFNSVGFAVTSRQVVLHPPPPSAVPASAESSLGGLSSSTLAQSNPFDFRTGAVSSALLAAMLLLEVVLLAGPAFAVGVRRRRDELALLAAAGCNRRHLLTFVTVDGIGLGLVAALIGASVGTASGVLITGAIRNWSGDVPGPVTIRTAEIAGLAALAVISGLLASLIPALSASRQDTGRVLRGRQLVAKPSWWPAVIGIALVASAIALGIGKLDERTTSGFPAPLVLAATFGEIGFALVTPGILALLAIASRQLPLFARLALRDASRNRSAAAPAAAAIIAVVAATAATLVFWSTVDAHQRRYYQPSVAVGDAHVYLPSGSDATAAITQLRRDLPRNPVLDIKGVGGCVIRSTTPCLQVTPTGPPTPPCQTAGDHGSFGLIIGSGGQIGTGPFYVPGCPVEPGEVIGPTLVDDGKNISTIVGGPAGTRAASALRRGEAVVFTPMLLDHGRVPLDINLLPTSPGASITQPTYRQVDLAGYLVRSGVPGAFAGVVLSPTTAAKLGIQAIDLQIYVKGTPTLSPSELRRADDDLTRLGLFGLTVERGYHDQIAPALLAVIVGDLVLTLGAAVMATALLTIDSRDDLMTFAAVGAPPRTRRRMAMARAGVICVAGSVFGAAAGLLPGIGLVWRLRHVVAPSDPFVTYLSAGYPLSIPWADLVIIGIAAPLAAIAVSSIITRAGLPIERRRIG